MKHRIEFDCRECGRHLLICGRRWPFGPLCALCVAFPGWFNDPEARRLFDPEGLAKPPPSIHTH